jgi:hypothetical protein
MLDTLPKDISPATLSFCASLAPGLPVWVKSKPDADAVPSFCFDNVRQRVLKSGGKSAFGYAIWHLPNAYFEAEHHAVWEDPEGLLLDVSPQYKDYPEILFLRDDTAVYDPANFRPNVLTAQSDDPLAQAIVTTSLALNHVLNTYRIIGMPEAEMTADDEAESQRLTSELDALLLRYRDSLGRDA